MVRDELGREDAPADSELDSMEDDTDSARANRTAARMAAPAGLAAQLMPFQEEGLAWMCAQEAPGSAVAGGILADEVIAMCVCAHTYTHSLSLSHTRPVPAPSGCEEDVCVAANPARVCQLPAEGSHHVPDGHG